MWVVASLKLAVPHALVGVVVAEFLTGSEGLGYMLSSNAAQFNAAGTFASVVVLAAISFALDRIVFMIDHRQADHVRRGNARGSLRVAGVVQRTRLGARCLGVDVHRNRAG